MIQSIKAEMRRQARGLERMLREMEALQQRLLAEVSEAELSAMTRAKRPLSPEAHFVAVLQRALVEAEEAAALLRLGALEETLQKLDRAWRKGEPPDARALAAVQAARALKRGRAR